MWFGTRQAPVYKAKLANTRGFLQRSGARVGFLIVVVPLVGIIAYLLCSGDATGDVANLIPTTVFELVLRLGLTAPAGFTRNSSSEDT
jgi:hypothetical protein